MAFQFTIWDKFKELGKLSEPNRNNLGKFLTHLFATKALSLSIFKVRIWVIDTINRFFAYFKGGNFNIFISGRGSAISSAKEGKSGFIYNLVKI